jgi:hypothetical protein
LANVTFEKGSKLKSIEYGTFTGAIALKTIDIPPSVTSIDPRAFSGATNLERVTFLPVSKINKIGESAFADTNLKLVVMGEPVLKSLNAAIIDNNVKLRFGEGNTFYGANNVAITSMTKQADKFFNVAKQRGVPLDAARLSASFLTGRTPKAGPKGGRKRATRKGGRRSAASKKKMSRRRKTTRRKAR